MVHILTHNDLDGYAAGYVVLQHFGKENCDVVHLNYDKEPAIENFKIGDKVFITDYSLTNDQYRQIQTLVGEENLVWCDHHITAINRYKEEENIYVDGIRSTKYCGAVLTWCYFNDIDTEEIDDILSYNELIEKVPLWLRLVDAWDTWKLDSPYRINAEYLNISVHSRLSMDLIAKIAKNIYDGELLKIISMGKAYTQFRDQWAEAFAKSYGFEVTMSGKLFDNERIVQAYVLTLGNANSQFFGSKINEYDVCITQCFDGTGWKMSLYSTKDDIDVSVFAKRFGGGGHKGASGCYFHQEMPPLGKYEKGEI